MGLVCWALLLLLPWLSHQLLLLCLLPKLRPGRPLLHLQPVWSLV